MSSCLDGLASEPRMKTTSHGIYVSRRNFVPPTRRLTLGPLSQQVLTTQDRPPGKILGRRRREQGTLLDPSEDDAEPGPPPLSWLAPALDTGPSTSAEAQRHREAMQRNLGPKSTPHPQLGYACRPFASSTPQSGCCHRTLWTG
ncbi:hypothetical protein ACLKA7_001340 [Drosophila subpalustris]